MHHYVLVCGQQWPLSALKSFGKPTRPLYVDGYGIAAASLKALAKFCSVLEYSKATRRMLLWA
jgi:hypothetical protein